MTLKSICSAGYGPPPGVADKVRDVGAFWWFAFVLVITTLGASPRPLVNRDQFARYHGFNSRTSTVCFSTASRE